ncbi:hypothetical protein ONO23_05497 [Micromonospora noduli]|nr:hypothetical protein ONO23_05497 [Micromonospora noduli]
MATGRTSRLASAFNLVCEDSRPALHNAYAYAQKEVSDKNSPRLPR